MCLGMTTRHCERSAAIQRPTPHSLNCRVAALLAMTFRFGHGALFLRVFAASLEANSHAPPRQSIRTYLTQSGDELWCPPPHLLPKEVARLGPYPALLESNRVVCTINPASVVDLTGSPNGTVSRWA